MNKLYYGDNLDVLERNIQDESVDLIYLDPPFNSNRNYNIIFRQATGNEAPAQVQAFGDTWSWSVETEQTYQRLVQGQMAPDLAICLESLRAILGPSDMLAYIVMMAPRLFHLRRVLKATGSLYLHCDATASHYLKILLDAIFGADQFRNEIIWRRTGGHGRRKGFGPIHDTILFYSKSDNYYFNVIKTQYTADHVRLRFVREADGRLRERIGGNILTGSGSTGGESGMEWRGFNPSEKNRHWAIPGDLAEQMPPEFTSLSVLQKLEMLFERGLITIEPGAEWPHPVRYLREDAGTPLSDIWAFQPGTENCLYGTTNGIDYDVMWLGTTSPERLGYPTQKPVGLLGRILRSSCPEDGVVLDPFCGCGTTIDSAQGLGLAWIGIDITYLSIDLIINRLQQRYNITADRDYEVLGIPRDRASADALFRRSPLDFERWVVSRIGGTPNERQVGDAGIDGRARFPVGLSPNGRLRESGQVLISVKGGSSLNPGMVRDLQGVVSSNSADLGILITRFPATTGMSSQASRGGYYTWPPTGANFPKTQILTVDQILAGDRPNLPPLLTPYYQTVRADASGAQQGELL